jgi:hypothetical protein
MTNCVSCPATTSQPPGSLPAVAGESNGVAPSRSAPTGRLAQHYATLLYDRAEEALDPETREAATRDALDALWASPVALEQKLRQSLDAGWSEEAILEVVLNLAAHAGFPAALDGVRVATQVLESRRQSLH